MGWVPSAPLTWSDSGSIYYGCMMLPFNRRLRSDFQRAFGTGRTNPGLSAPTARLLFPSLPLMGLEVAYNATSAHVKVGEQ